MGVGVILAWPTRFMLYRSRMSEPEPHAKIRHGEAYKRIIDVLEKRRKLRDAVLGPPWFQKLLSRGPWLALLGALALLVVAGAGALAGWSRPLILYPAMLATLALLLALAIWVAALAGYLLRRVRSKGTRRTQTQLIIDDCLVAEQLATCSVLELRILRLVLAARLDRLRIRESFVLGPAAKLSPFLILLLLVLLSKTEIAPLLTQIAPWATKLASSPLGAFALCLVTVAIVFVRFRVFLEEETVSVDLMLIDAGLKRTDTVTTAQGLHREMPTTTGSTSNAQTAVDEAAAPPFAPVLTAHGPSSA